MAIARWSSDQHRSAVYVYESSDGWVILVATNKLVSPLPEELPVLTTDPVTQPEEFAEEFLELAERTNRLLEHAVYEPIGGPWDGQMFILPDEASCLKQLLELRDHGYHVPEYAIEALTPLGGGRL